MKNRADIKFPIKRFLALGALLFAVMAAASAAENYVIRSVSYEIEGRTKQHFIENLVGIKAGDEFADKEALEAVLEDRRQILANERVLESAQIVPAFGEPFIRSEAAQEGVSSIPVDLVVRTKDTFNIIGLPYFKYDSNTGYVVALRGRDYNFFGTMEPLILNANWEFKNDSDQTPGLEAKFSFPFRTAGLDWTWDVDTELTAPNWKELDFSFDTGIAAELPVGNQAIVLYARQGFDYGAEDSSGAPYDDEFFFTTSIGTYYAWSLAHTRRFGDLILKPAVELEYRWLPGGFQEASLAQTPKISPGLSASIGRVNWVGNFREGLKADASLTFSHNFSTGNETLRLAGSAAAYSELGFLGPSARFSGFANLNGSIDSSAGNPIRGVINNRIKTVTALFLNLDLPVSVINFRPADWFGVPWMRYFHFEQHWSPFVDVALVKAEDRLFSPDDAWIGTGLEVITFPKVFRSFYVRISAAWDLRDVIMLNSLTGLSLRDGRPITELFFGVGHHY